MKKRKIYLAITIAGILALAAWGCSSKVKETAKEKPEERIKESTEAAPSIPPKALTAAIPELGLSIRLPAGWKQGRIAQDQKEKFAEQEEGTYFFESTQTRYPYGSASVLSKPPYDLPLDQYTSGIAYAKILSKVKKLVGSLEAIEIVEEDIDAFEPDKQIPITAVHLYIQNTDALIWISYWTESQDFDIYQPALRKSLDSVTILQ